MLGVNSILPDGSHFLMWDFDGIDLYTVNQAIEYHVRTACLSNVYIFQSSVEGNYHAYCLSRVSWGEVISILALTPYLDQQFLKLGMMRGYMTLRFTDKLDSRITLAAIIESPYKETVAWSEMRNFERYWTLRRKHAR